MNILFDTGQSHALLDNAEKLALPIDRTDVLVLSHGHYDHTGGLPYVIQTAPSLRLFCHPEIRRPRFSIREGTPKPLGLTSASRAALDKLSSEQIHWVTEPVEIAGGIGITGPIPRYTDYETTGGPFFLDSAGKTRDPIIDDMAIWFQTPKGLVVFLGCGHAGLINTLTHIRELNDGAPIHAVLGGFHLVEANRERVDNTLRDLSNINPDIIVPCHCTGGQFVRQLKKTFGDRVVFGRVGAVFTFGDDDVD